MLSHGNHRSKCPKLRIANAANYQQMLGAAEGTVPFAMGDDSFRDGFADSWQRFELLRRGGVHVYCVGSGWTRSSKLKLNWTLSSVSARGDEHGEDNYDQDGE